MELVRSVVSPLPIVIESALNVSISLVEVIREIIKIVAEIFKSFNNNSLGDVHEELPTVFPKNRIEGILAQFPRGKEAGRCSSERIGTLTSVSSERVFYGFVKRDGSLNRGDVIYQVVRDSGNNLEPKFSFHGVESLPSQESNRICELLVDEARQDRKASNNRLGPSAEKGLLSFNQTVGYFATFFQNEDLILKALCFTTQALFSEVTESSSKKAEIMLDLISSGSRGGLVCESPIDSTSLDIQISSETLAICGVSKSEVKFEGCDAVTVCQEVKVVFNKSGEIIGHEAFAYVEDSSR